MAFMGLFMMYAMILLVVLGVFAFLITLFTTLAIVFSRQGIKYDKPGKRIAGKVFMVIDCMVAAPMILYIIGVAFNSKYKTVTLPSGKLAILHNEDVEKMKDLAHSYSVSDMQELGKLLDEEPNLVYYVYDNNYSILDEGLKEGRYDLVKTAIEHGVPIDDNRHVGVTEGVTDDDGYKLNTLEIYLNGKADESFSEADVTLVELLLENSAKTEVSWDEYDAYSNALGKAAWVVLNNDESVDNREIDFVQAIAESGCEKDERLANALETGKYKELEGYNFTVTSHYSYAEKVLEVATDLSDEDIESCLGIES